jgi:hypothetical protein
MEKYEYFPSPLKDFECFSQFTVEHSAVDICCGFFMVTKRLVLHFFVRSCALNTVTLLLLRESKSSSILLLCDEI